MATVPHLGLVPAGACRWELPQRPPMRVPGVVFATDALLPSATGDQSLSQVANVATLPGIVKASYAMPDIHWGYGFPIGGVAATDADAGGGGFPRGGGVAISWGVGGLVWPPPRAGGLAGPPRPR